MPTRYHAYHKRVNALIFRHLHKAVNTRFHVYLTRLAFSLTQPTFSNVS